MSDRVKLTGLWKKEIKDGAMLAGKVDRDKLVEALGIIGTPKVSVAVFKNGFKDADSKPDYILYLSPWEDRKPEAKPDTPPPSDEDNDLPW